MQHWPALLGITVAIGIGAASPGPSFVLVARTAVSQGRTHGLLAAAGIGAGGLVFAVLALLGLHSVLSLSPMLYLALKLAGGLYLAWLGWRIWRSAQQPLHIDSTQAAPPARRAFATGLFTQLSNPKPRLSTPASLPPSCLPSLIWPSNYSRPWLCCWWKLAGTPWPRGRFPHPCPARLICAAKPGWTVRLGA